MTIITRSPIAKINAMLSAQVPEQMRWVRATWQDQRNTITDKEIEAAIATGQVSASWSPLFANTYADWVNDHLEPQMLSVAGSAADQVKSDLLRLGITHDWSSLDYRLQRTILARTTRLPVQFSDAQLSALQTLLSKGLETPAVGAAEMSALIRPMVGLTSRQTASVLARRAAMIEAGATAGTIERTIGAYALAWQRRRAQTIARTELVFAYASATEDAMDEVVSGGEISEAEKEWGAQDDERQCPICGALDGDRIPLDAQFNGGLEYPPAHPNCRCVVLYHADL